MRENKNPKLKKNRPTVKQKATAGKKHSSESNEQQDKRTNNMIIVNIPESKDEDPAERKANDTKFISDIFSKMSPEADLSEISDPIPLGDVSKEGTPS